jgi:UDP-N-acetylglucosamine 2-epimerase (non-hydrolysing)
MKTQLKWLIVGGARPNFMKIAPLIKEINQYNEYRDKEQPGIIPILVHTGQHYDDRMSKVFFDDLGLPKPDIDLGIGSASHAVQTAKIMIEFEKICLEAKPDLVIVVGDVNSTLACSLVAVKLGIKVAHIEAGLRSFDRSMPEEINRIVTDSVSDYLFTTCEDANKNLVGEGMSEDKIYFVGNLMVDTLLSHKEKADKSHILETLKLTNGNGVKDYALMTLHRPSNVDVRETFEGIIGPIHELSNKILVIFPAHLRTQKQINAFGMEKYFYNSTLQGNSDGISLIDPLGYLDFLKLMANAKLVLSDSGGIQEETTILGIPCLTIRENTERPVTVTEGTNELVGTNSDKIISYAEDILLNEGKAGRIPALWDGNAANRIVRILTS